jgi:hypothetical protein
VIWIQVAQYRDVVNTDPDSIKGEVFIDKRSLLLNKDISP